MIPDNEMFAKKIEDVKHLSQRGLVVIGEWADCEGIIEDRHDEVLKPLGAAIWMASGNYMDRAFVLILRSALLAAFQLGRSAGREEVVKERNPWE